MMMICGLSDSGCGVFRLVIRGRGEAEVVYKDWTGSSKRGTGNDRRGVGGVVKKTHLRKEVSRASSQQ